MSATSHYETVTKPALRALSGRAAAAFTSPRYYPEGVPPDGGVLTPTDVAELKALCDAAASAGATRNELEGAVGGVLRWNTLVRAMKAAAR